MLVIRTKAAKSLSITAALFFFLFSQASYAQTSPFESGEPFSVSQDDVFSVPEPTPLVVPSTETPRVPVCDFKVYFINVGQGDSSYIQLPSCRNVLIDGGPYSTASSTLAKFLAEHKITSIDYVVLTHPHTDHYKGLTYVFKNLEVRNFYDTAQDNSGASTLQELRELAKNEPGISISYPSADSTLEWDPLIGVKVLHAGEIPGDDGNMNNASIVIKMTYQDSSLLFMGDAEKEVEMELVKKYGEGLRADVLKVGHHGSDTSSTDAFLDMVRPKAAYVSVGKNSYGLPAPSAMARLEKHGAAVYRTDYMGTMEYLVAEGTLDENASPVQPRPWEWDEPLRLPSIIVR